MSLDWDQLRNTRSSGERPEEWPEGVHAISMEGLSLLGIHEKENKLFWDGQEIVTKSIVRLGTIELWFAGIATSATFGMFVLSLGSTLCWWN